jgi:hypothetical protein
MGSTLNVALAVPEDARAVARIQGLHPARARAEIRQATLEARAAPRLGALLVARARNSVVGICRIRQTDRANVVVVRTKNRRLQGQITDLLRADALIYCHPGKRTIIKAPE